MPRKAKPAPDEACVLHLRDLRREHGRPPADATPPEVGAVRRPHAVLGHARFL